MELVPLIIALVGIALTIISLRALARANRFERTAHRTPGLVVALRWRRHSSQAGTTTRSTHVAHPVVRFALPDGRTVELESASGSNPAPAREGETVDVLYDPADPSGARLDGIMHSGRLAAVMGLVVGLGFVVLGSVVTAVFLLVRDAV